MFRFCGKEVVKDAEYNITITAKDNTEKIRPVDIGAKRKLIDKCTPGEITALRSVTASLAWVARQVRPRLSYRVSKLQTICGKATIKDLKTANKVLEFAFETSTEGLYYKAGAISWDDAVAATLSDAWFEKKRRL